MFTEIDTKEAETLRIAERLLSDSEEGKKTIDKIKKDYETFIETSRRNNLKEHKTTSKCWCKPKLDYENPITHSQVWVHNK